MIALLRSIAAAFSFLTRLPVPARAIGAGDVAATALGRSVVWFPLVGALIGGSEVTLARLLGGHLPPGLIAIALVALSAALTGGLHLDGLADTFDGWAGGRGERARTLEIMRDSRIGAHGAAALVLLLAAKIVAVFYLLPQAEVPLRSWPLLVAPVLARWAVVPLVVFFDYARTQGLGSAFQTHARTAHVVGTTLVAIGAAIAISAATPSFGDTVTAIGIAAASALGVALALAALLDRRLGGLTGDVYGAAIELTELAVLVSAVVTTGSR